MSVNNASGTPNNGLNSTRVCTFSLLTIGYGVGTEGGSAPYFTAGSSLIHYLVLHMSLSPIQDSCCILSKVHYTIDISNRTVIWPNSLSISWASPCSTDYNSHRIWTSNVGKALFSESSSTKTSVIHGLLVFFASNSLHTQAVSLSYTQWLEALFQHYCD